MAAAAEAGEAGEAGEGEGGGTSAAGHGTGRAASAAAARRASRSLASSGLELALGAVVVAVSLKPCSLFEFRPISFPAKRWCADHEVEQRAGTRCSERAARPFPLDVIPALAIPHGVYVEQTAGLSAALPPIDGPKGRGR